MSLQFPRRAKASATHVHKVTAAMTIKKSPPSSHPACATAIGIARRPVPTRSPSTFSNYLISIGSTSSEVLDLKREEDVLSEKKSSCQVCRPPLLCLLGYILAYHRSPPSKSMIVVKLQRVQKTLCESRVFAQFVVIRAVEREGAG